MLGNRAKCFGQIFAHDQAADFPDRAIGLVKDRAHRRIGTGAFDHSAERFCKARVHDKPFIRKTNGRLEQFRPCKLSMPCMGLGC